MVDDEDVIDSVSDQVIASCSGERWRNRPCLLHERREHGDYERNPGNPNESLHAARLRGKRCVSLALIALFGGGALCAILFLSTANAFAGPPFETDDPVPVACHNIEVDIAQARQGSDMATSTPTGEIDYGPTQNIEVSIAGQSGEVQLGSALRFVTENATRPQVAFLPSITFKSDGTSETFLPIWLQKSWGPWTAFGGGGISQNIVFSGVALQHDLPGGSALGVEFFHSRPRSPAGEFRTNFNVGYTYQIGERHAIMLAVGRSLIHSSARVLFYAGYQVIVAPHGHAANCTSNG